MLDKGVVLEYNPGMVIEELKEKSIGEKLKFYRHEAMYPQKSVELRLKMSFGSLSKIESGQTNPTKETMKKLANLYELTLEQKIDLFGLQ